MDTPIKDSALRTNIFASLSQDGLVDINCGLGFILFGLSPLFEQFGMSRNITMCIYIVVVAIILRMGRYYITQPRLGVVRLKQGFSIPPRYRNLLFLALAILAVCFLIFAKQIIPGVIAFLDIPNQDYSRSCFIGLVGGLAGGAWWNLRKTTRLKHRFLAYYLIMFFGQLMSTVLGKSIGDPLAYGLVLTIPGLVILILGMVILVRFMKAYPVDTDPMNSISGTLS